jgi:hypothetical protein
VKFGDTFESHADNKPISVGTTKNSVSMSGAVLFIFNHLIRPMSHILQQAASVALLAISFVLLLWIVFS